MPATAMELKVRDIVTNGALPRNRKLDELRKLRSETRGVQPAGRESRMSADDGVQDDLRVVEKALQQLGGDTVEATPVRFKS